MIPLLILIAVCCLIVAAMLWADATGFDPFAWLYGSDYTAPADVQAWRDEHWGGE